MIKKRGRPKKREVRETMTKVFTFRADAETQSAIAKLMTLVEERMPMGAALGSVQAAAIRHGLIYAAGKLASADPGMIEVPEKS